MSDQKYREIAVQLRQFAATARMNDATSSDLDLADLLDATAAMIDTRRGL